MNDVVAHALFLLSNVPCDQVGPVMGPPPDTPKDLYTEFNWASTINDSGIVTGMLPLGTPEMLPKEWNKANALASFFVFVEVGDKQIFVDRR